MEIKEENIRDWGNLVVVAGWSRINLSIQNSKLFNLCFSPERYGLVPRRLLRMTELRQEPWFYPELPQATAISLLKRQGPGSFLLRTHKKKHLISFM
jgi:hypothetical protein